MVKVLEISKTEWAKCSEDAHRAVFNKVKPGHFDRIDYALLAVLEETDQPVGFVTVREVDHETVYWQFGGGFSWARKSILMGRTYDALLEAQSRKSKRMVTYIENENVPMLRLALSRGLRICGLRSLKESALVEFVKEW